jgi:hypothetical protein
VFADECVDNPVVVIGGYESGIDAALADRGQEVLVVDEEGPWQFRGPDPSEVLSPYTSQRLQDAFEHDVPIGLEDGIRVKRVDVEEETFNVIGTDGASFTTRNRPVLATGLESGLVTRITASLHLHLRRVGLAGRDLVRVVMGFGCNVPAVTSTRGCSDCTRRTTVSAIGFGSACSYQFPATLAAFAAVEIPWLVLPYLGVLTTTTLVYARLIAPERARTASLAIENRAFLQWPTWQSVWRETRTVIRSFFLKALPVFAGIVLVASLLDYFGVLNVMGEALGPVMGLFNLPGETALVVVMGRFARTVSSCYSQTDSARRSLR